MYNGEEGLKDENKGIYVIINNLNCLKNEVC